MSAPVLAREGRNCWKRAQADRFAFLIEASGYYEALADALDRAQRSVFLLGWDVHSRTPLRRPDGDDGRLAPLLQRAVARSSELEVRLLVWDCNTFCKLEREKLQTLKLDWRTHDRIRFELDSAHPLGACHHQKVVVIDDAVAFVGGIDVTARRWDTREHAVDDDRRVGPDGSRYPPYHDVHTVFDGPAAAAVGELARERWRRATGEDPEPVRTAEVPWPRGVEPVLRRISVGLSRTEAKQTDRGEVREIEALYLDALAAARRFVYIENQYLSSERIGRALVEVLERDDGPEVCIVGPERVAGWLEESLMGQLRARIVRELRAADLHDRLRVWYPDRRGLGDTPLIVHSKLMVVDDRFATVGSANLSNRSMGLDSECNVFIEADGNRATAAAIVALRDRLLAEHLDREPGEIARAIDARGSVHRAVESLRGCERTLEPLDTDPDRWPESLLSADELLDPERPLAWTDLVRGFFAR